MNFKLWFEAQEPELYQQQGQMMQQGAGYAGSPYPEGGEIEELAAAAQGKKPAALISARLLPQFKKNRGVNDIQLLQKMLLRQGLRIRPDFTYQKIPMSPWVAVGGEKEVKELVELMKMQHELDLRSSRQYFVDPFHRNRVEAGLKKRKPIEDCPLGSAGTNCEYINRRIGQLLGYSSDEIDKFMQWSKEANAGKEPWFHYPSPIYTQH